MYLRADLAAGTVQKVGPGNAVLGTDTLMGVDVLIGTSGADQMYGRDRWGDGEEFRPGAGNDYVDGRGGRDTVNYADAGAALRVNLAAGTVTGTAVGTDTLRQIEGIVGTAYADRYDAGGYGGASVNRNSDGEDLNLYNPQGGNDTVIGNGSTALGYAGVGTAVSLSLAGLTSATQQARVLMGKGDAVAGGGFTAGSDLLAAGVNALQGGQGNDTLLGGGRVNKNSAGGSLVGDTSFEAFRGEGGNDYIDGGSGMDRAEYDRSGPLLEGITVHLADGIVEGDALALGTDTLRGIESVTGTILDDVFDATGFTLSSADAAVRSANSGDVVLGAFSAWLGSNAFNEFRAVGGNDVVLGNGATRLSFKAMGVEQPGSGPSVVASFDTADSGTARGGLTDGQLGEVTFSGVYGVVGGVGNDSLTGTAGLQELRGYWGNDTLRGGDGDDRLFGYDNLPGNGPNLSALYSDDDLLDGSAGNDLLRGEMGQDTLLGGAGNDSLEGGTGDDSLAGGDGDDWLIGDAGNDTLDGGADGRWGDTLSYRGTAAGVTVNLTTGIATGSASGTDRLLNLEHVEDTAFADSITGNDAGNWFRLGAGDDTVDGGAGIDVVMYEDATAAVTINLALGTAKGASIGTDTLRGIEAVQGSGFGDAITLGNAAGSYVFARAGNDSLTGGTGNDYFSGGSGADTINGGAGSDTASYAYDGYESAATTKPLSGRGVTANLATGRATDNWVDTDVLTGIENLEGSALADSLTGDLNANALSGGAGNDTLVGGTGTDTLTGGDGADRFVFTALGDFGGATAATADQITDFTAGQDLIDLSALDANTATATNDAFSAAILLNAAAFTATAQLRLYNGVLYGNTDANLSTAEFALRLTGVASVSAASFAL